MQTLMEVTIKKVMLYEFKFELGNHIHTLKDFKNAKSKFINLLTFNVSILLRFGKNEHQYVSKTCFKPYVKIMNKLEQQSIL